ncbi:MAG: dTDP-4-dehydrorhamnose 3,5-epimerase [Hyphomicrobiales bacterium]|nr:dTDP-4-dehydrorhamnose 3,5-epimerase [Hyphomicrobiales bacterium]
MIGDCADIVELKPKKFGDGRGFFSEVYNRTELAEAGFAFDFIQDNHSLSRDKGTVRGLHFQVPPFAQTKLVRVVKGAIFDVAVDIRTGSPTYGRHASIIISAQTWNQVLIPVGFAHGFCTLEPDTEVLYKVDAAYSPQHDRGLLWNDPALAIEWPVEPDIAVLSDKDRNHPTLSQLPASFQ